MTWDLEIRREEQGPLILKMAWAAGRGSLLEGDESMRKAAARWLDHGVVSWSGSTGDKVQEHTPPEDPLFLPRLHSDLARQFPFHAVLRGTPEHPTP